MVMLSPQSDLMLQLLVIIAKGYCNAANSFIVSKLLDGFRRLKGRVDSRLPIIDTILDGVVGVLGNICANTY